MHFSPLKGLKRNKAGGGEGGSREIHKRNGASSQLPPMNPASVRATNTSLFSFFFFRELDFTYFSGFSPLKQKPTKGLWPMSKFVALIC